MYCGFGTEPWLWKKNNSQRETAFLHPGVYMTDNSPWVWDWALTIERRHAAFLHSGVYIKTEDCESRSETWLLQEWMLTETILFIYTQEYVWMVMKCESGALKGSGSPLGYNGIHCFNSMPCRMACCIFL